MAIAPCELVDIVLLTVIHFYRYKRLFSRCENEKKGYSCMFRVWFEELHNDEQKGIGTS